MRGKTRCWRRMTYELLPVERIFHAKQKIKVLAEGDRAKLIERDFHAQEKR
mgnify:FL=1